MDGWDEQNRDNQVRLAHLWVGFWFIYIIFDIFFSRWKGMHVPRVIAITFIGRNVRNVRDSNRHFAPFDNPLQLLDMKVKFFAQIKVACARAGAIKEIRHGLCNHVEFILRHLLLQIPILLKPGGQWGVWVRADCCVTEWTWIWCQGEREKVKARSLVAM